MRLIRLLKNDLARESAEWVKADLITESQAQAICARYDVDYHQAQSRSFGYNLLVGLGYLFIGLALITLLGANWEEIPRALRMWGLIAITLATQGFALYRHVYQIPGSAVLFLLGNLFFGAAIILIAQVYHLGEHMPDGVFWWALGSLPFGLLTRNAWLTLQALLLGSLWFGMEVSLGFYPLLFPLFIAAAVWVLYRGRSSIVLFLAVVAAIGFWVEYSLAAYWRESRHFDFDAEHLVIGVALFILAYVCSHWLNHKTSVVAKDYGTVLALWSLRFGLLFLLVMSFEDPWRSLIRADWEHQWSMFVLVLLLSALSLWMGYLSARLKPVAGFLAFYLLLLLAVLGSPDTGYAIYFQILINIVLVAAGVYLIVKGIAQGISHYFFLGVLAILLTALMRYADLIGDYIGGALLFLVFAAVLLGSARYWKKVRSREGAV